MLDLIHNDAAYKSSVQIARTYGDDREWYNGRLLRRVGQKVWMYDDKYGHEIVRICDIEVRLHQGPEEQTLEALHEYLDDCVVEDGGDHDMLDKIKRGAVPNLKWTGAS